jgi:hypothetical protein
MAIPEYFKLNMETQFLPTARSAVGLGITLSPFHSLSRDKTIKMIKMIKTKKQVGSLADILMGLKILDTTWRYLTLLDAT